MAYHKNYVLNYLLSLIDMIKHWTVIRLQELTNVKQDPNSK